MLSNQHLITFQMLSNQHLSTFDNIKCHRTNIRQHSITLNVIEPACANITDAGSITFDHILMTFYHIFDKNVTKRFPDN
jgi:hypothetical protein